MTFQIKDRADDSKDQLKWKWTKGAATTQPDFGDPLGTTTYALCVYDHTGGVPTLATVLVPTLEGKNNYRVSARSLTNLHSAGVLPAVEEVDFEEVELGRRGFIRLSVAEGDTEFTVE